MTVACNVTVTPQLGSHNDKSVAVFFLLARLVAGKPESCAHKRQPVTRQTRQSPLPNTKGRDSPVHSSSRR